jgi:hypothetical protein
VVPPTKLLELIQSCSAHDEVVRRLREADLLAPAATDGDILRCIDEGRREYQALGEGYPFSSADVHIRNKLSPYLSDKGHQWDEVDPTFWPKPEEERSTPSSDRQASGSGDRIAYRSAVGVAVVAALVLAWLSLGVGIIGKDGDPANGMYLGVLAVGIVGAIIARFQPPGMARALIATAVAQALVAVIAVAAGLGRPWSGPAEVLLLNGFFVALFAGSAWLFRRSAPGRVE